ncbi:hypothetical protein N7528_008995 [Penicillium herquei]|nr:hypothetical protein N7528_008995 [Penicillium herquei]
MAESDVYLAGFLHGLMAVNPHFNQDEPELEDAFPPDHWREGSLAMPEFLPSPTGTATLPSCQNSSTFTFPTSKTNAFAWSDARLNQNPQTPQGMNAVEKSTNALLPAHASHSLDSRSLIHSPTPTKVVKGVVQTVFRAHGVQRSRFDDNSRKTTAFTRKVGACAACKKKKIRCDQSSKEKFVPCNRCAKLPPHLLREPCCRIEIIDIKLFRLGSTLNPNLLQQWMIAKESQKASFFLQDGTAESEPPRHVYLTQDITTISFAVTISRFQPGTDDVTAYHWTDSEGNEKAYDLPPYYISDMVEAGANMRRYAKVARQELTSFFLADSNPIIQKTFQEAERYYEASKSDIVAAALIFWSATRMIERFWLICGDDRLGMPPMKHNIGPCRWNPLVEAIPVTPVMDTQLDELAIGHVLIPLKNNLLRLLKAKIYAKKRENWYEIYLACFIVLHNSERVLSHIMDFSRRFGVNPSPRSNGESPLSDAYYHACKTVLAYFHFASGGAAPLDRLSSARNDSVMDQRQIKYLQDIRDEVQNQNEQLQALKGKSMYETEMYWCHQMLLPGWEASMPHKGSFLEFTEKDFLVT